MPQLRTNGATEEERLRALQIKVQSRLERKKNPNAHQARIRRYREKNAEKLKAESAERSRKFREKAKELSFEEARKRVQLSQIKKWANLDRPAMKDAGKPLSAEEHLAIYGYGAAAHSKRQYVKLVNDPVKYEVHCIRAVVTRSIWSKPGYSEEKIINVIGCRRAEFIAHIEKNFQPGMSWENRKEWVLSAVKPFRDAKTIEEARELGHYTNWKPVFRKVRI